jgi:hypothetical protein
MDKPSLTPRAVARTGELTTFYAYDSGAARSRVLAGLAGLLATDGVPVLMIDWDLESPGLQQLFGSAGERPGLLEFIEACRDQLAATTQAGRRTADPDALAREVLAAVDWRAYIEQVDAGRPLYLMRAGRVDDTYGERVAGLDWSALFHACPALLRQWRAQMAQAFRHVFIDARGGRSAAVSVCTSLLPDKIVALFSPTRRSLDGLCGVVQRAIDYRCTHEDEQRPLLLYPFPWHGELAGAGSEPHLAWRRGAGQPGYQAQLEALMRASYGCRQLSLENYFDQLALPDCDAPASLPAHDSAALAPVPGLPALLDWFADGYLPWQSHAGRRRAGSFHHDAADATPDAIAPAGAPGREQFHALRSLDPGRFDGSTAPVPVRRARASDWRHDGGQHGSNDAGHDAGSGGAGSFGAIGRMGQLVDAVETQLDQLQQLVDQQALREARPVADRLRQLVLRPPVAQALRRRGAALIKLVYRHDNDTDALLAFTQDELASLEQVLNEAAAGRPLAFS